MSHTPLRTLVHAGSNVAMLAGGMATAHQIGHIPGVAEGLQSLEDLIVNDNGLVQFTVDTAELIAGAALFSLSNKYALNKPLKKRKLATKSEGESKGLPANVLQYGAATVGAVTAGGLILGSYNFVPELAEAIAGIVSSPVESINNFVESSKWYARLGKAAVGVAAVGTGAAVYRFVVGRKHGPVLRRYKIDGFMPYARALDGKNLKQKADKMGIWQSNTVTHLPDSYQAVANVKVIDMRTGKKIRTDSMWRDTDIEPSTKRRSIDEDDVTHVVETIKSYADANDTVSISEAKDVVRLLQSQSGLMEQIVDSDEYKTKLKPSRKNVMQIAHAIAQQYGDSEVSKIKSDSIVNKLRNARVIDNRGHFSRLYSQRDASGNYVAGMSIEENLNNTRLIGNKGLVAKLIGPGDDLIHAFYFRKKSGQDLDAIDDDAHDDFEDHDDEHSHGHGVASNKLKQYVKGWNQALLNNGLGSSFDFEYRGNKYTIQEEWLASVPVGVNRRVRRKFYVRQGDTIVGKIQEDLGTVLTKHIGNNNRTVDVYEKGLATDDGFGQILCVFSEYMVQVEKYRRHRKDNLIGRGLSEIETMGAK